MNDWTVKNTETGQEWYVDNRSEAQERINDVAGLHDPDDFEITPPKEDVEPEVVDHTKAADGGAEVVEEQPDPEELEEDPDIITSVDDLEQGDGDLEELGESLDTDPLSILPGYMITHVDGKPSLNKRGVSVLAYHYGVSVNSRETVAYPHETDYTSAVVQIEVENEDGRVFVGSGEAHADETPKHQLLRMAETRAYKRAVIFATGTGIVGYQEIMEELQ